MRRTENFGCQYTELGRESVTDAFDYSVEGGVETVQGTNTGRPEAKASKG